MKLIKFRRLENIPYKINIPVYYNGNWINIQQKVSFWEIAFNEKHLFEKLNGEMAEIIMPAKSWVVQLWRKIKPIKLIEGKLENRI